jgi:hypothetical protein
MGANAKQTTTALPNTQESECIAKSSLLRALLDHFIRSRQHRRRDGQAEDLGSLEVDHQFELGRLLHGEIGGLGAPQA